MPSSFIDKYTKTQNNSVLEAILAIKADLKKVPDAELVYAINIEIERLENIQQSILEEEQSINLESSITTLQQTENSSTARESLLKYQLMRLPCMSDLSGTDFIEVVIGQINCIPNGIKYPLTYSTTLGLVEQYKSDLTAITTSYLALFAKESEALLSIIEGRLKEDKDMENIPDSVSVGMSIYAYLKGEVSTQALQEGLNSPDSRLGPDDSCIIM
jgi:hypothetical protein